MDENVQSLKTNTALSNVVATVVHLNLPEQHCSNVETGMWNNQWKAKEIERKGVRGNIGNKATVN